MLVYLILDQLVDTFFPCLEQFDNDIDELEDAILVRPTEEQLGKLFDMKRSLIGVRRVVTPQRDMFAGVSAGITQIPGVTEQGERYMRDLYDHLIRISDLVDSYRDLLSGVMDTHLSTVSNRLNQVMKQLTIIATVFLPLSFLTGFFGQNFAWLVNAIRGTWTFVVFGLGLEVLAAAGAGLPVPQARLAGRLDPMNHGGIRRRHVRHPSLAFSVRHRPRRGRAESTAPNDRDERSEPRLRNDPTDSTEQADPAEPSERTDPAEPMERIEPVDPTDRMEPTDPTDHGERALSDRPEPSAGLATPFMPPTPCARRCQPGRPRTRARRRWSGPGRWPGPGPGPAARRTGATRCR